MVRRLSDRSWRLIDLTEVAVEAGAGGLPEGGSSTTEGGAGAGPGPTTGSEEAKYPNSGSYWLDYVKNDGADVTSASDTACDAATDGPLYSACVHGGEIRRVALPEQASCTGISAKDELLAFDWTCQAAGSGVEVVSTGLQDGKHMSDLIDFAANTWKLNSVNVTLSGEALVATEPAAWWDNPMARLAGASCVADVGKAHDIFLLDEASSSANCTGSVGKIGLATVPGATVTDLRFTSRGAFNWFEGAYTLQAQFNSLTHAASGFQVVRNASFTALATGSGNAVLAALDGSRASVVRNITATGGRKVVSAGGAVGLQVSDITSTGARVDVITLNSCTDCSVQRINVSDAVNRAIYTQGVNVRLLIKDVVVQDVVGGGVYLFGATESRVENIKVTRSGGFGVAVLLSSGSVVKSVVVDNAVGVGVSVDQGNDNRLVDIHVGNAGANAVFVGGHRNVLQHARLSCGKGASVSTGVGVQLASSASYSRMQDVTTTSCRYGVDLNGPANVVQAVTVAATEDVGIRFGTYGILLEDAVALDTSFGMYFLSQVFDPPRVRNFASSHNQDGSVYANNSTVDFAEQLIVGNNGPTGTAPNCTVASSSGLNAACGGNAATLTTGASVLNSIVGLVSDATNPQGATGSSGHAAITSFTTFASETRRFIRAGAGFPDFAARGPCMAAQTCSILDLALKANDTLLRNRNALPTGNDVTTHAWSLVNSVPADQATCDGRVPGSVFVAGTPNRCNSVFLKHAWELLEDGVGDNDGFCESNETCEVARNIGGYQGHGPFVSAGAFTPGTLTGITLVQRQTNGY